jgi:hypothetical protein
MNRFERCFESICPVDLCVITLAEFKFNVYALSLQNIDLNIQTKIWSE